WAPPFVTKAMPWPPSKPSTKPSTSILSLPWPITTWASPFVTKAIWRAPSPPTTKPSNLIPSMPSPITIWARGCMTKAIRRVPTPLTKERLTSTPNYNLDVALRDRGDLVDRHRRPTLRFSFDQRGPTPYTGKSNEWADFEVALRLGIQRSRGVPNNHECPRVEDARR